MRHYVVSLDIVQDYRLSGSNLAVEPNQVPIDKINYTVIASSPVTSRLLQFRLSVIHIVCGILCENVLNYFSNR